MHKLAQALLLIACLTTSCQKKTEAPGDSVAYWLVTKKLEVHPKSILQVDTVEHSYRVVSGAKTVFIFSRQDSPVFKPGKKLTDLYTKKALLIEVDPLAPNNKPRILRKIVAFNPYHGIKRLPKHEVVQFRKAKTDLPSTWWIESQVTGLTFRSQMDLESEFTFQDTYKD